MTKKLPIKFPTEEAVKKALKIHSFRELSKDKIMQFASMIPYIDKEVAIAIISQFPTYADYVKSIISFYVEISNKILEDNKETLVAAIRGYQTTLDALSRKMDSANTEEERKAITKDMICVADKIAELDSKNKKFLEKILTRAGIIILGAAALVGAAVGINSAIGGSSDLPQLDDKDCDNDDDIDV